MAAASTGTRNTHDQSRGLRFLSSGGSGLEKVSVEERNGATTSLLAEPTQVALIQLANLDERDGRRVILAVRIAIDEDRSS